MNNSKFLSPGTERGSTLLELAIILFVLVSAFTIGAILLTPAIRARAERSMSAAQTVGEPGGGR